MALTCVPVVFSTGCDDIELKHTVGHRQHGEGSRHNSVV